MIEWFAGLETEIQVAIITVIGGMIAAVIKGVGSALSNKHKEDIGQTDCNIVNQSSSGNYNTIIGIQINKKDDELNE